MYKYYLKTILGHHSLYRLDQQNLFEVLSYINDANQTRVFTSDSILSVFLHLKSSSAIWKESGYKSFVIEDSDKFKEIGISHD